MCSDTSSSLVCLTNDDVIPLRFSVDDVLRCNDDDEGDGDCNIDVSPAPMLVLLIVDVVGWLDGGLVGPAGAWLVAPPLPTPARKASVWVCSLSVKSVISYFSFLISESLSCMCVIISLIL